jgi:hypothetical protein
LVRHFRIRQRTIGVLTWCGWLNRTGGPSWTMCEPVGQRNPIQHPERPEHPDLRKCRAVIRSLLYLLLRRLHGLFRSNEPATAEAELEIAVLRHQLAVLRRQVKRPVYGSTDRAFVAAVSRFLPRELRRSFMVRPETLLRWHRQLIRKKWTTTSSESGARRACRSRASRPLRSSWSTSADTAYSRRTTCSTAERTGRSDCEPRLSEGRGLGAPSC